MEVLLKIRRDVLQWGRARMSAEIREADRFVQREVSPSMGPRSDERGNDITGYKAPDAEQPSMGPRSDERGNANSKEANALWRDLQWGRARMSAEIWFIPADPEGLWKPSMGPRSDERGNGVPSA